MPVNGKTSENSPSLSPATARDGGERGVDTTVKMEVEIKCWLLT
jgi:hypothetical protein